MRHMMSFSGGMDSVYVLYSFLRDNPKSKILVHRVDLNSPNISRLPYESKATANVFKWLRDNGLNNFEEYSSTFDYGTLPYIGLRDIQVAGFFAAIIINTPKWKSIDTILFPWHKGEVNRITADKGIRIRNLFLGLGIERKINFAFPIEEMSRKDMFKDMPLDLYNLVSSCRRPSAKGACQKCRTCLEYIKDGLECK